MATVNDLLMKFETIDAELNIRRGFGSNSPLQQTGTANLSVGNHPTDYTVEIDPLLALLETIHTDGLAVLNADPPPDELPDFFPQVLSAIEASQST